MWMDTENLQARATWTLYKTQKRIATNQSVPSV